MAKTTGAKKTPKQTPKQTPKNATTKNTKAATAAAKKTTTDTAKRTTAKKTTTKKVVAKKAAATKTPAKKTAAKAATAAKTTRAVSAKTEAKPEPTPTRPPLQRDSLWAQAARVLVLLLAFVCMVGFAVALARATLVPSPGSSDLVHTNLRPGASLRAYLDQPAFQDTVKQIGGNVLLGAPFGVLLPMLMPRARGAVRVVLVTGLVMVMVETAQGLIVEGRAFDVDDVILNTSGALLGYVLIGRLLGRALHPRRHHWWHRWTKPSSSSAA
ncbi:VanZ family protein [Streptomyces coffeae]|uniref:VanZ family protein n=1 Tax=Streptomyces coffeae TaxID=621382 RepID=UPI0027DC3A48|nr:VanZ family protein [Streptomyces coffeae]